MPVFLIIGIAGSPWGNFPKPKAFFEKLEKWKSGLESDMASLGDDELAALTSLVEAIEVLCVPRRVKYASLDFTKQEIDGLILLMSVVHSVFGGTECDTQPADVDAPRPFKGESLLRSVEATAEMLLEINR